MTQSLEHDIYRPPYLASALKLTQKTRCMRLVWYTSRERPDRCGNTRTVLSYDADANSCPVGEKETSMTADTWSLWIISAFKNQQTHENEASTAVRKTGVRLT